VVITIIPSLYFGYDIVQQNRFQKQANLFIENEAVFPNDYLLRKVIDPKNCSITLIYGGEYIDSLKINMLKSKLSKYQIQKTTLTVQQGFAYLKNEKADISESDRLSKILNLKESEILELKGKLDSLENQKQLNQQIFRELKAQYPSIQSCIVQPAFNAIAGTQTRVWIAIINSNKKISQKQKIEEWLKVRLNTDEIIIDIKD
jgi:hypothetical protein